MNRSSSSRASRPACRSSTTTRRRSAPIASSTRSPRFERYGGLRSSSTSAPRPPSTSSPPEAEYVGGVIAPGLDISAEALFAHASRLYRVDIRRPPRLVGKTTAGAMQSGLYFGYVGLVDGVIDRIAQEIGTPPRVIATGGLAELFGSGSQRIEEVDPLLTLKGLALIHEREIEPDKDFYAAAEAAFIRRRGTPFFFRPRILRF